MICTIASASLFGNEILEASTEKIRSLVEIGLNYNPQSFDFFDFLFLQNLNSIILPFYLISGFILLVPVSYFLRKSPSSVDYSDQVFARSAERFLFFPFLIAYSGMLLWNLEVFTYELITLFNLEWLAVNPYFIITIYAPIPVWLFLHSIYYKKIRNLLK